MNRKESGFTLIELLITLAITGLIVASLGRVVVGAIDQWHYSKAQQELLFQAQFAMDRMIDAVSKTNRLMIPLADNPDTGWDESERNILAVTLDPTLCCNEHGEAYADNDSDGLIDEDIPADNNNDGGAGIAGFDDNGNGAKDEEEMMPAGNNDEYGSMGDDPLDGADNDNDGSVDEDIPDDGVDNDSDGSQGEDWFDSVVYFVEDGKNLIEQLPPVIPSGGARSIAEAYNIRLNVKRIAPVGNERAVLLRIELELKDQEGNTVTLESKVRVGGGR